MRRMRFGPRGPDGAGAELVAGADLTRAARHAGRSAAGIIRRRRREVPALAGLLAPGSTRLLLVAGVLLDLLVGDRVRRRGETPTCPANGVDWVLPNAPLTTGIRCTYESSSAVGVAVLWVAGAPELPLPPAEDLAARRRVPTPSDAAGATRLLRLRHTGWAGDDLVVMREGSQLRRVLGEVADVLVTEVNRPLYERLRLASTDQLRHLANRLVLDFAVAELLAGGDLPAPDHRTARRLMWTGPNWALAADAARVAAARVAAARVAAAQQAAGRTVEGRGAPS